MPKKLYTVKVEFDFVIVADNEKHAEVVGRTSLREAFTCMYSDNIDMTVQAGVHASNWDNDCLPYGQYGRTTAEYLEEEEIDD